MDYRNAFNNEIIYYIYIIIVIVVDSTLERKCGYKKESDTLL